MVPKLRRCVCSFPAVIQNIHHTQTFAKPKARIAAGGRSGARYLAISGPSRRAPASHVRRRRPATPPGSFSDLISLKESL
eukprot:6153003-Prymnesium_polylepis.1